MAGKHARHQAQRQVSFGTLARQSLLEMWSFQLVAGFILVIPAALLENLIMQIASSSTGAITTANLGELLEAGRLLLIAGLTILLVFLHVVFELFAPIHFSDHILHGKSIGTSRAIGKGLTSLSRFLTPAGLLAILYVAIATPICGFGFSIGLTRTLHIPHFIMSVVWAKPLYAIAYVAIVVLLIRVWWFAAFTFHAVILDGMTPREGIAASRRLIMGQRRQHFASMAKLALLLALVGIASFMFFLILPTLLLTYLGEGIPTNYIINLPELTSPSTMDLKVIRYRALCSAAVIMGNYLMNVVSLLCTSYTMLYLTRRYEELSGRGQSQWPERPRKAHYLRPALFVMFVTLLMAVASLFVGLFYNQLVDRDEPVRIVAHRAGGSLASENSLEGIEVAVEHHCYGSEIDVQRTADGAYVINHDDDFGRLTGVAKKPGELTLAEVEGLRITDTTGSGALLPVPTLDQMLDAIKGREMLFIELKGVTADRQMVDDVVRMVYEHECEDDVALISLNYDIIDYAESTYPELTTGTLFFAGIGDISRLNCDLIIMEEESASDLRVYTIHAAGKQAVVWTVNGYASMRRFLDSPVDAIITDEIVLAEEVQAQLDTRTDLQVIQEKFANQ